MAILKRCPYSKLPPAAIVFHRYIGHASVTLSVKLKAKVHQLFFAQHGGGLLLISCFSDFRHFYIALPEILAIKVESLSEIAPNFGSLEFYGWAFQKLYPLFHPCFAAPASRHVAWKSFVRPHI